MTFAIIEQDTVINRILADESWVEQYCDDNGYTYTSDPAAQIGYVLEEGEWVRPEPEPAPVPEITVTRFQAKAALSQGGYLPAVDALMSDPETDAIMRLEWLEKPTFSRSSPTLLWAADQLELTEQEVDDLFTLALSIAP